MSDKIIVKTGLRGTTVTDYAITDINNPIVVFRGGNIICSDGNHTFEELYDHRITLYIALCKKIQDFKYHGEQRNILGDEKIVWRSKLHSDGSSYEDWFILGINKEQGEQITYHLPMERWEETNFAVTLDKAPEWDGHTSQDVLNRLKSL